MRSSRSLTGIRFERLDGRTLFSAPEFPKFDENGEIVVPTGGGIISISGTLQNEDGSPIADDFGVRKNVTVMIGDQYSMIARDQARKGNFKLPSVKADGSVHLEASADADQITVERVSSDQPADDGEADFVLVRGEDGKYRLTGMTLSADYLQRFVDQQTENVAKAQARLDEATAGGSSKAIEDAQKWLATHERILREGQSLQAKFNAGLFVRYTLAGVYDYYVEMPPNLTGAKITIDAGAGTDNVSVSTNVPIKASIFGGSGSDTLTSGKRATQMFGGGGNDRLISRSIHGGSLDGGKGSDRYYNRGTSELKIAARNDGDRLMVDNASFVVTRPGTFGSSAIDGRKYYLVDDVAGQIDLLG